MKVTANQLARVQKEYSTISGEQVTVEFIDNNLDSMYVFGSELAMYRLHYKMGIGRVEYSENLETWFYTK